MMTDDLLTRLQASLGDDLLAFLPELIVSGAIVLLLLFRMLPRMEHRPATLVALMLSIMALGTALGQAFGQVHPLSLFFPDAEGASNTNRVLELFSGMLIFDNFTIFFRIFLLAFLAIVVVLTALTGIADREDSADFFTLLFGATLGMMLMSSANHLLMVFIAVEMASLPSYAMAGFLKGNRPSSEAALKYVVYGGGAAGVMLYGISLLAGKFGTAYLPDVLRFVGASLAQSQGPELMVVLGLLFLLVGIAFKLSAVPFHFWCPDVFEGAPAEVGAFLSIASKAAALALLARFTMPLAAQANLLVPTLAFVATITTTFGNLAAYGQTNLKRLLAYSTIAHAGFMMMGLATMTTQGAEAVLFYLVTYLLMNLGAFAVVAFLRNVTGSEDLKSFRGLVQRAPVMVCTLAVFMLSLIGLPPLAGFAAKFQIFTALFDAAKLAPDRVVEYSMYTLVGVGGLNTVLSLFYYVKVLKVMILDKPIEEVEGTPAAELPIGAGPSAYAVVLAALVLALGVFWNPLAETSRQAVKDFPTLAAAPAPGGAAPTDED
jgi:NADH-quinone oxidoreductase subunit N